jgi:hypothetical protein
MQHGAAEPKKIGGEIYTGREGRREAQAEKSNGSLSFSASCIHIYVDGRKKKEKEMEFTRGCRSLCVYDVDGACIFRAALSRHWLDFPNRTEADRADRQPMSAMRTRATRLYGLSISAPMRW